MVVDMGLSVINFNGCGGGSSTTLDIFDENGKIKAELLPDGTGSSTFALYMSESASDTPSGVTWFNGTEYITGTLEASEDTLNKIYFVLQNIDANAYNQYATFVSNENGNTSYVWKCIGSGIYDNAELNDIEQRLSKLEESSVWIDAK